MPSFIERERENCTKRVCWDCCDNNAQCGNYAQCEQDRDITPYVQLDMNPILPGMDEKSCTKTPSSFLVTNLSGCPNRVCVAKKGLFKNPVPRLWRGYRVLCQKKEIDMVWSSRGRASASKWIGMVTDWSRLGGGRGVDREVLRMRWMSYGYEEFERCCLQHNCILADDVATTLLLHQYNALAFWTMQLQVGITLGVHRTLRTTDMNPILPGMDEKSVHKDAIFFLVTNLSGCPNPGVLVSKKGLFKNPVPNGCGGGTVFFVRLVLSHLRNIPEVLVLGNSSPHSRRLAVFSFLVRHPRGTFLHHNFVCAVLNDVFGVQARGGCACAGPYAQDLMGIDHDLAAEYEDVLMEDSRLDRRQLRRKEEHSAFEMLRPGFTRISLPYFMSDAEVTYVLEAVKMVATEGWKLLPQYLLNPETGEWRHHTNSVFKDRKWLGSIRYVDGKMSVHERRISGVAACPADHNDCLHTARNIFNKARKMAQRYPLADQCVMFDERTSPLRWFMLPSEAQDLLLGNAAKVRTDVPFMPREYHGSRGGVSPPTTPTHCASPFARHNSLSALDIKARRTRERLDSQSPVTLHPSGSSPQIQFNGGSGLMMRERCYSLDSNNKLPLATKTSASSAAPGSPLALLPFSGRQRQRQISCGSQTDLSQSGNEGDTESRGTSPPTSMSENAEQIQVYLKEVTKELATEIKSEIREVINKVEDVLSESADSLETNGSMEAGKRYSVDFNAQPVLPMQNQSYQPGSYTVYGSPGGNQFYQPMVAIPNQVTYQQLTTTSSLPTFTMGQQQQQQQQQGPTLMHTNSNDSVSLMSDHVAEYLAELTSEVVSDLKSELKSEFREMVSAVDGLISPDARSSSVSENGDGDSVANSGGAKNGKCCSHSVKRNGSMDGGSVQVGTNGGANAMEGLKVISENISGEELLKYGHPTLKDMRRSTMNSISSQDSGINMNYHGDRDRDRDSSVSPSDSSQRSGDMSHKSRRQEATTCVATSGKGDYEDETGGISFEAKTKSNKKLQWHCPPKNIWKPTTEAIKEFGMVEDGDRVLVCLSGGKDSLSLLHTLHQYQYYAQSKGVRFQLGAATVDPGSTAYDPRPLVPYMSALGVHYLYEEQSILEQASAAPECKSICSFCSRMKRGRLYATARAHGYNVLALGQHLDDLAESFLMSTFHNGRLRSMKAHYLIREQDLRVIRPFVYVREKSLRQFAESRKLPVIPENCPACFEAPKERHRTKQLLAQQEILFPKLFLSLRAALKPLISFRKTGEESKSYNRMKLGPCHDDNDDTESVDTEEDPVSVKSNSEN
ncbi:hypothetical protein LSTR_LSTR003163 [Laodelphax striatellus]|uniref:tRNA(Ile)-lysidine/2-thiocytidine synthase N-terminal domain-containing protein n=1 Tax=Laodelphax striatellus TaxID=195883 RepID=A0A482WVV3_LAOST|nr:hypothetical protein LSTR_LSTR003163 [Laodelphax striatellus]